ncbi:lantibiotic dehydratase C-terminal domain-containing protein [Streptomyces griseosporeus]|uniref:lantibiotic dehydratase C-terminal domain-containing protein n=1 Tax=Streptomyces griseosporeus TaxID=1910 RepID=UPI00167D8A9B|nr:lantibiotic dehydratase C-terminal domain-containing protein [Streptomyces griseosporeus]GHF86042.1 hypothetical protein GCM10018783_65600 [Streptomyces griseosporeus]
MTSGPGQAPAEAAHAAGAAWLEIGLDAPADAVPALVAGVVRPLLREPAEPGAEPAPGFFLRGVGAAQPALVVQLEVTPGTDLAEPYAARARALAAGLGLPVQVAAGPATLVPLAGSVFAGAALGPVTRAALAAVCPALLAATEAAEQGRPALLASAVELMSAHLRAVSVSAAPGPRQWEELREGVPLGFLSYRSHAEAFLASSRDPKAAQAMMDAKYTRAAATLERLVDGVLTQCEERGPVVSLPARQWYEAMRAAKPAVTELFRAGTDLALDTEEQPPDTGPDGKGLSESAFHRIVEGSDGLRDFLDRDPSFLATRLLTSLLYLSLSSVGIALAERYFLCYAVSRACESIFDTDALTVLSGLARTSLAS